MKKIILGLAVAVSLMSCSNNESKMKTEIKSYLDKKAKDPKSYEFVDLKIIDTVSKKSISISKVEMLKYDISSAEENIVFQNKLIKDYPLLSKDGQLLKIKNNLVIIKQAKKDIQTIAKDTINLEVVGYVVEHNYRLKNGFGALDLSKSYINFDKDFKLLDFNDNINYSIFKQ